MRYMIICIIAVLVFTACSYSIYPTEFNSNADRNVASTTHKLNDLSTLTPTLEPILEPIPSVDWQPFFMGETYEKVLLDISMDKYGAVSILEYPYGNPLSSLDYLLGFQLQQGDIFYVLSPDRDVLISRNNEFVFRLGTPMKNAQEYARVSEVFANDLINIKPLEIEFNSNGYESLNKSIFPPNSRLSILYWNTGNCVLKVLVCDTDVSSEEEYFDKIVILYTCTLNTQIDIKRELSQQDKPTLINSTVPDYSENPQSQSQIFDIGPLVDEHFSSSIHDLPDLTVCEIYEDKSDVIKLGASVTEVKSFMKAYNDSLVIQESDELTIYNYGGPWFGFTQDHSGELILSAILTSTSAPEITTELATKAGVKINSMREDIERLYYKNMFIVSNGDGYQTVDKVFTDGNNSATLRLYYFVDNEEPSSQDVLIEFMIIDTDRIKIDGNWTLFSSLN